MKASGPNQSRKGVWVAIFIAVVVALILCVATLVVLRPFFIGFLHGVHQATQQATAAATGGDLFMKIASDPVTIPTNSATMATVRQRRQAFRMRDYVEAYQQNGPHTQPWDAEAQRFLTGWIDQELGGGNTTNAFDAAQEGDKLVAAGADDPLILTVTAITTEEWHEGRRRLQRAVAAFDHSNYKAYPRFYAQIMLGEHAEKGQEAGGDAAALDLFAKALKDGSVGTNDLDDIADSLVNGWAKGFFYRKAPDVFAAAYQAGPDYRWLALSLDGIEEIALAWQARGDGFANTVTQQGWQGFADHLAKARTRLTEAWQLHPEWPLVSGQMMRVCLGQEQTQEERTWFDRAVAAQVDDLPAWDAMRWLLRPRWGGSLEAMRAFGVMALNTERFDTDVPYELLRSVSDLESESQTGLGNHLYDRPDLWPQLQRMSQGYVDAAVASSNKTSQLYWRGNYAELAFLAHDYKKAREELAATAWAEPSGITTWGTDLSLMRLETAARTSSAADAVDAAEKARRAGNLSEALNQYQQLARTANLDDRTTRFIQTRLASIQMQQQLAAGQTVDFLPKSDDDPNWETVRGAFKRNADGSIDVTSGPTGSAIFCHAPIGLDFSITGEFDVVKTTNNAFQAGLLVGWPDPRSDAYWSFRVKRNSDEGDVAEYNQQWSFKGLKQPAKVHPDHNTFSFTLWHGLATASVNGEVVMRNQKKPGSISVRKDEFALGLGAYNDMNETTIRYSNLKLHRLGLQ